MIVDLVHVVEDHEAALVPMDQAPSAPPPPRPRRSPLPHRRNPHRRSRLRVGRDRGLRARQVAALDGRTHRRADRAAMGVVSEGAARTALDSRHRDRPASRHQARSTARSRNRHSISAYDAGSPRTFPSGWRSKASPQPTWPTKTRDNNRPTTSSARTRPAASGALKRELPASWPASAARPIRPVDRMTGGSGFGPRYSFQFLAGS